MIERVQVGALNLMASQDKKEMIDYSEKKYHDQLEAVAQEIIREHDKKRFVLISGPSASGKTFSARLLRGHLEKQGVQSLMISLDNFYRNREDMPLLENGHHDLENVSALDIDKLHQCFIEIKEKGRTYIPHFNFKEGRCDRMDRLVLKEHQVLILEGIHALNPILIPGCLQKNFHKYYISLRTNYDGSNGQMLGYRDIRLIRRMIRDFHHRGTEVTHTLQLWQGVLAGERKYITPYISHAQRTIDSTHLYEPMLYESLLRPLIPAQLSDEEHKTFDRLLGALASFEKIKPSAVPDDSLLVEFIR